MGGSFGMGGLGSLKWTIYNILGQAVTFGIKVEDGSS